MSDEQPSRREAIRRLASVAALGVLPACSILGRGATEVAPLEKVPEGSALRTTVRDQPVILVNVGGKIRAFSGICTHESCELGWNQRQQLIRCPCHGSAFSPDGKVEKGPATLPLPEFRTSVRDGRVYVEP